VLHIGAMKTGTTFLQQVLTARRGALADHGFQVPREQGAGLRSILAGAHADDGTGRQARVSRRLLRTLQEYDGRASVLSWEFLSFVDRADARRLLDTLAAEVDVILTVRDAARTMPAQWQTRCRNGTTLRWPRFSASIGAWLDDGRPSGAARVFERTQGVPRMLDVWTDLVGPERVTVVTVPAASSDRLLLWRRFAEAAGVDAELDVDPEVRSNPSLGYPSCELLRRVNEVLGPDAPDACGRLIRAVVAPDLETRAATEPRVRPDARGLEVAAAWNRATGDAIRASGVRVLGDLDADVPSQPPAAPEPAGPPTDAELLAAAETARAGLVDLGATDTAGRPADVDAAVADLARMIRATAGVDLTAARRARGRGRG
jgi:hypothetical protein